MPSTPTSALFGTDIADYWFPVAQGGDIAFIYGVLKSAIGMGWIDEKFLAERCNGWPAVRAKIEWLDWPALEKQAGLPKNSMEEFARMMHAAKTGIFIWSMGITQHPHGADGVQMILNLAPAAGSGETNAASCPSADTARYKAARRWARIAPRSPESKQ